MVEPVVLRSGWEVIERQCGRWLPEFWPEKLVGSETFMRGEKDWLRSRFGERWYIPFRQWVYERWQKVSKLWIWDQKVLRLEWVLWELWHVCGIESLKISWFAEISKEVHMYMEWREGGPILSLRNSQLAEEKSARDKLRRSPWKTRSGFSRKPC